MKIVTIMILTMAAYANGQDAKVVQLTPDEAAQARALYQAQTEAETAWTKFRASIEKKYVRDYHGKADGVPVIWSGDGTYFTKPGWEYGFEFDQKFNYIVPTPYQKTAASACVSYGTFTPAYGVTQ